MPVNGITIILLTWFSGNALAVEGDRYQFLAGISYTYDGNVFRVPTSGITPPKKDLIRQTYAGIGLNLPISRQRIIATVRYNQTRFRELETLDYNGRSINATWLWQAGNDWSGRLGYSQSITASDFSNVGGTTQNLRDQSQAFFDAFLMLDPTHRLEAGVSQARSNNSAQANQTNDYKDNQIYFGIQYISAANNSYGVRLSFDDLKLPNPSRLGRINVDNSHKQTVLDFNYAWQFNGVSRIFGRIGYEDRSYGEFEDRDYSGLAWSFSYDWTPNDKSAVLLKVRREIDGLNDFASSYVLVQGISVKPRWIVSSKVNVAWDLSYSKLDFRGDPGIFSGLSNQDREDKIKTYGMSVGYSPLPSTSMSLSIHRDQRSSTLAGLGYEDTVYAGGVDFRF
jgi:exopolysaccharide biosynthesis operon protein EpsL